MGRGRRCAREGCRAWARRESEWCVAHPEGQSRRTGGAPEGNQNARTHGLYARYVPVVALERALELPPGDLRIEIAVTRSVLADVMQSDMSPAELLKVLETGATTLTRLLRTNKQLADTGTGDLKDDVRRALAELGPAEV